MRRDRQNREWQQKRSGLRSLIAAWDSMDPYSVCQEHILGMTVSNRLNLTFVEVSNPDDCTLLRGIIDKNSASSAFDFTQSYMPGVHLPGAYLVDANFGEVFLSEANLSKANLSGANFVAANLNGANLSGANLRSANLRAANFAWANLSGAYLIGTDLSGANLRGANFFRANLATAKFLPHQLTPLQVMGALGLTPEQRAASFECYIENSALCWAAKMASNVLARLNQGR